MPGTEVQFMCGHSLYWREEHNAPKRGDRTWCQTCRDMRNVLGRAGQYVARCRDCRFDRTYTKHHALAVAVRAHLGIRKQHTIHVTRIGQVGGMDVRWTEPVTSLDQSESLF